MAKATSENAPEKRQNLYVFNLGLLFFKRARRILEAHGFAVRFGMPRREDDMVAVWGHKKTSHRGRAIAKKKGLPVLTVEDSFLRSVRTGRQGDPSLGVVCDHRGIFFDTGNRNELEGLIASANGIPQAEIDRAKAGIEALKTHSLSKYNAFELQDNDLPNDYVLVVDQTVGDASIRLGGADKNTFDTMLACALKENPGVRILIKVHPETRAGKRKGHFLDDQENDLVELYDKPTSPWALMKSARRVYCVTSQMGMEAIFAGHRPVVFGRPFYAGWGLSDDRNSELQQKGLRSAEHLFWAAYLKYSFWYDPFFNRASTLSRTVDVLSAQASNRRDVSDGAVMLGMRLWKRGFLKKMFAQSQGRLRFVKTNEAAVEMAVARKLPLMVWGQKGGDGLRTLARENELDITTVEDGFVRSKGLGAALVKPCSLVLDKTGIYYDPNRPSDLEDLIQGSIDLPVREVERASALRHRFCRANLSKYNLGGKARKIRSDMNRDVVLVVGQVEDDASVQLGCSNIKTNTDLVWAARQAFPEAYILYKPHPDVEAGLRPGAIAKATIRATIDGIAKNSDIVSLIKGCDVVCTMTSLAGFEALLHQKKVVCFGMPFYAGWGLTDDHGDVPERRTARPSLDQLVHACLISYPRYWDPVTGKPCPAETVFERFEKGQYGSTGGPLAKPLSKLQGVFASFAPMWR